MCLATAQEFLVYLLQFSVSLYKLWAFVFIYLLLDGEGNGTPLQYSCLENPMDGGAW